MHCDHAEINYYLCCSLQISHKRSEILTHPLVQGMIDASWNKYKWLFYLWLLLHIIFVIFFTSMALIVNNPRSETCKYLQHFLQARTQGI